MAFIHSFLLRLSNCSQCQMPVLEVESFCTKNYVPLQNELSLVFVSPFLLDFVDCFVLFIFFHYTPNLFFQFKENLTEDRKALGCDAHTWLQVPTLLLTPASLH